MIISFVMMVKKELVESLCTLWQRGLITFDLSRMEIEMRKAKQAGKNDCILTAKSVNLTRFNEK
ncbi:hypothetical protein LCGC14_2729900 [marine sediment metagenome]|uniref:Uncharacterized protein n=1 Tax=marine sediment metagenome TaxID=412755 RepID=A0A0F8ZUX7_9ZZZZ